MRKICPNGGYNIYIYDLIDEHYDLEKTINNISTEIIKTVQKLNLEIKKNIILKKMHDFNKTSNYVEDKLFIEKIKSIIYKIENIRDKNSKAKQLLILMNSMQIKKQKNLNN